jgi:hypothetical protein
MAEISNWHMQAVQRITGEALATSSFHPTEVIFGLTELVGRLIVAKVNGTWIQKKEVYDEVCKHLERTIKIGLEANGQTTPN